MGRRDADGCIDDDDDAPLILCLDGGSLDSLLEDGRARR